MSTGRVSGCGRTYPGNAQQLHLAVREEEGEASLALPLEFLEVRLEDGRAIALRWGISIMPGSGGHGARVGGQSEQRAEGSPKVCRAIKAMAGEHGRRLACGRGRTFVEQPQCAPHRRPLAKW